MDKLTIFTPESNYNEILNQLVLQIKRLEIPYKVIAKRSSVSLPTIKRIVAGNYTGVRFDHILKVAACLGIRLVPNTVFSADDMRQEQAEKKARKAVSQIQATSALEAQGVAQQTMDSMEKRLVNELLAGSARDLWDE